LLKLFRHGNQATALLRCLDPPDRALFLSMAHGVSKFKCLQTVAATRYDVTHLRLCVPLLNRAALMMAEAPDQTEHHVSSFVGHLGRSGLGGGSSRSELETFACSVKPTTVAAWFLCKDPSPPHGAWLTLPPAEPIGLCVALCRGDLPCLRLRLPGSTLCDSHAAMSALPFGSCEELCSPLPFPDLAYFARSNSMELRLTCFKNSGAREYAAEFGNATAYGTLIGVDKRARPILELSGAPAAKKRKNGTKSF
jgi:hypothetical protein